MHQFLAVSKSYVDCILAKPEECCCDDSVITYQKWFLCYHLPRSLKMFFNIFSFLHVKANLRRVCEEISSPFFFRKMVLSAVANYLRKISNYPQFSLWILITLAKIYFFHVFLIWQKHSCIL